MMQMAGRGRLRADVLEQVADAEAAELLVVGQREMDRQAQPRRCHLRHQRQRGGDEALHVRGAAAVELAAALDDGEGIALPGLARHRHHVGMAGQHDAAGDLRPDGGKEVGLRAVGDGVSRQAMP